MAYTSKFAVLVAGGKGTRMGSAMPKQFLPLLGKPVLYYTILAFIEAFPDVELILVLPPEQLSYAQMVLSCFPEGINITIVAGGPTRFHSVQNGLNVIDKSAIVFIHDGVRPLVSPALIKACYNQAVTLGSAIPVIPVTDSIRNVEEDRSYPVNRDQLRVIQTPQTFRSDIIIPAYGQLYRDVFTDEATVAEAYGASIHLISGDRSNLKVTTPEDIIIAEALLNARDIHGGN